MEDKYKAILYFKRPISNTHQPMSLKARASQFASFDALKHKEVIEKTNNFTNRLY